MECIRKHKSELFNRNVNLMHAIKCVLDTKDIYHIITINKLIQECAGDYVNPKEKQNEFWNYYHELFGTSANMNIPVSQAVKPRKSH